MLVVFIVCTKLVFEYGLLLWIIFGHSCTVRVKRQIKNNRKYTFFCMMFRFSKKSFTVQILENEHAGTLVEHLDVRASSSLFFEMSGGNLGNAFTVNPSTGSVTTVRPLDREHVDFYNLTISATNSVSPQHSASSVVIQSKG